MSGPVRVETTNTSSSSRPRMVILAIISIVIPLCGLVYVSRTCDQAMFAGSNNAPFSDNNNDGAQLNTLPVVSSSLTSSSSSFGAVFTPQEIQDDETALHNSIRQPGSTKYLPAKVGSCDVPIANVPCSSNKQKLDEKNDSESTKDSSSCCCCCWHPHTRTCVGTFSETPPFVLEKQIAPTGLFSIQGKEPVNLSAAKACPWWDFGLWSKHLPWNFLSLSEDVASQVVEESCGEHCGATETDHYFHQKHGRNKKRRKIHRGGIGQMLVWRLGRLMHQLRPHPNASFDPTKAPGGVMMFSGDSMTRQLFSRFVHTVRSRECSAEAEMRRQAVFELQIHDSAAYIATTVGDAYVLGASCDEGLRQLTGALFPGGAEGNETTTNNDVSNSTMSESTLSSSAQKRMQKRRRGRVLLQACFVWDNTPGALMGTVHNLNLLHFFKDRRNPVASLVFFPNIWWCGIRGSPMCMNANQSNGAAFTVIGSALHYEIPRIVISNNVVRQHFAYFNVERVASRNAQLQKAFPHVSPHRHWLRTISSDVSSPWSNVRLYDFARRHDVLAPEQCDVVHGMCMFLPARQHDAKVTKIKSLFGGLECPGAGGTCQDMGNFVLLHEIFDAMEL